MSLDDHEQFRQKLHSLKIAWQVSPRHGAEDQNLRWLPVSPIPGTTNTLGISLDGWWVSAGPGSVSEFKPGSRAVFLLPLLELRMQDVVSLLSQELEAKGLPASAISTLPVEDILVTALESPSEQWSQRALDWLANIAATPRLLNALEVQATKGPTQKIRQAAKKMKAAKLRATV